MTDADRVPIAVERASKTFSGDVHALSDASFTIAAGDRACLLGPNGAGKTTLIRLLTGALQPTSGAARLWGVTTDDRRFLDAKRRVGIVPQAPGMYRDLSVMEFLQLVRQLYDRGDVAKVLDVFGLGSYRDRNLAELSGGFQRRLSLAAALLPGPDLLLLDEPTVGLDPVAARDVHTYLRTMMAGRTTLLCTHNLAEAEALCDSVVILRGGRVLLHDTLARMRQRVAPQITLAAAEGPERLHAELQRLGHTPMRLDSTIRLPLADPPSEAPPLLRALLDAGVNVYECHVHRPSLEDLFLEIVGDADDRT